MARRLVEGAEACCQYCSSVSALVLVDGAFQCRDLAGCTGYQRAMIRRRASERQQRLGLLSRATAPRRRR